MRRIGSSGDAVRLQCERCGAHTTIATAGIDALVSCSVCGSASRVAVAVAVAAAPVLADRQARSGRLRVPALERLRSARFGRERRRHRAQRTAVDRLLGEPACDTVLLRRADGVFVYDRRSDALPPRVVRTRVWPNGEIDTGSGTALSER